MESNSQCRLTISHPRAVELDLVELGKVKKFPRNDSFSLRISPYQIWGNSPRVHGPGSLAEASWPGTAVTQEKEKTNGEDKMGFDFLGTAFGACFQYQPGGGAGSL